MPSEPLSPEAFADALRKGLGRALMHLRDHGDAGVEPLLEKAVTHNLSYDPQADGARTHWLFELLLALPDASRYRRAIRAPALDG